MKKRVLILGGTKFVGKELLNLVLKDESIELFIASRKEIDHPNFIMIDRKDQNALDDLFKDQQFDIVVDFICYSTPDAEKLINAIHLNKQEPFLISISTTYVYGDPLTVSEDKVYSESDFIAGNYDPVKADYPDINYREGKRSMESYLGSNYDNNKLCIIRFPIILGSTDYTLRTHYFADIINIGKKHSVSCKGSGSNYIFLSEAAKALLYFINNTPAGTFNVALKEDVNEYSLFKLYCEFYKKDPVDYIDEHSRSISPFFCNKDFIINCEKFYQLFPLETTFKKALFKELEYLKS